MKQSNRYWFGGFIGAVVIGLFVFVTFNYLSQARVANDGMIANQIKELQALFKKINDDCKIIGFRNKQDEIDFLTVGSFVGAEIGSMNLLEPDNWKGPYLNSNPTMQGKEYQIIKTSQGYFIVPGNGVSLSNGKVIGKTLIITPDSDIESMMRNKDELLSNGNVLAAHIELYKP